MIIRNESALGLYLRKVDFMDDLLGLRSFSIFFFSFSVTFLSSFTFSLILSRSGLLTTPSCLRVVVSRARRRSPVTPFSMNMGMYISIPNPSSQLHTSSLFHWWTWVVMLDLGGLLDSRENWVRYWGGITPTSLGSIVWCCDV